MITSSTTNSGSYSWTVPSGLTPASDYTIRITSTTYPTIFDVSDAYFFITPPPTITVTSPNGGESWQAGTIHTITWTSSYAGDGVDIELYLNDQYLLTIATDTENDGLSDWTIPSTQEPASDYQIRISSTTYPTILDVSDGYFTIVAPPSITVISPNGGESWTAGTVHDLTWTSQGVTGDVSIELYKGGSCVSTIDALDPNDGSYTWTIPTDLTAGTDYSVRIAGVAVSAEDMSDGYFSITVPSTPPTVPQNFAAIPSGDHILLTWVAPSSDGGSPITKYNIYRSTVSGGETYYAYVNYPALSYLDQSVTNGVKYYYKVTAVNAIDSSPYSSEASATGNYRLLTYPALGSGSTYPPGSSYWAPGTVVSVIATPWSYYAFDYWKLDGKKNTKNPLSVKMTADHVAAAYFEYVGSIEPRAAELEADAAADYGPYASSSGGGLLSYWQFEMATVRGSTPRP
jgi:hypothetical protein